MPIKPSEIIGSFFQELLAGMPEGNMDAIDRYMTADVEMIVVGTTSPELLQVLPWCGKHVGSEAVKDFFGHQLGPNIEVLDFGTDELIEQDGSVAQFGTQRVRARKTGVVVEAEYALRIKVRDGKI